MICKVCHNENQCSEFICHRCINTSPNLLLPLRLKVIQERTLRDQYSKQVDEILSQSLYWASHNEESSNQNENGRNIPLLGTQLQRVQMIKEVRRNNKIKQGIGMIQDRIERKRNDLVHLRELLKGDKEDNTKKDNTFLHGISDIKFKVSQVTPFLTNEQEKKLGQLNRWFVVKSRAKGHIYSMFYQRMVSMSMIQQFYDDNNNNTDNITIDTIRTSLRMYYQYLKLVCDIFYIPLPFTLACESISINIDETQVYECLTRLVFCCVLVCRDLKLFPQSNRAGKRSPSNSTVGLLLDEYDIDELVYCISQRLVLDRCQKNRFFGEISLELQLIQEYIEERCKKSNATVLLPSQQIDRLLAQDGYHSFTVNKSSGDTQRNKTQLNKPNKPLPFKKTSGNRTSKVTETAQHISPRTNTNKTATTTDRWFVVG